MEWVLLVPPKLAQSAHRTLVRFRCVARPWQLEGRYGSRTHRVMVINDKNNNDTSLEKSPAGGFSSSSASSATTTPSYMVGIPVLSRDVVLKRIMPATPSVPETAAAVGGGDEDDNITATTTNTTTTNPNEDTKSAAFAGDPAVDDDGVDGDDHDTGLDDLRNLILRTEGVQLVCKAYSPSTNRYHVPPQIDAQIHPDRAPRTRTSTTTYCRQQQQHHQKRRSSSSIDGGRYDNGSFTYAELFAGIGGFAVALEALGGTCVFASELRPECRHVYGLNFPTTTTTTSVGATSAGTAAAAAFSERTATTATASTSILHGDIYQVPDSAFPPLVDLLVAGFPCQPFSALGDQPGLDCPKNGNLFLQIVRFLQLSRPRAFLLENVPGLLRTGNRALETIVRALELAGPYQVHLQVCDARCLTACTRKRIYLCGFLLVQHSSGPLPPKRREDEQQQPRAARISDNDALTTATVQSKPAPPQFQFPYVPDLGLRARDVVSYSSNVDGEDNDELRALLRIRDDQLERLCQSRHWKPAHLAWPDVVCATLVSHYGNSISRGESQLVPGSCRNDGGGATDSSNNKSNASNPRRFSPRECARLMGFPATFQLPARRPGQGEMAHVKEQYRMLGNAVCPPLVAALVGAVLAHVPQIQGYRDHSDWEEWGRHTAIWIAQAATISPTISNKHKPII
jgi:DNA (cytosine-5)-methyltransferase 1